MKIAICAISKAENNYVEEWVNHYVDVIGADHIYLYDNNDEDYEDVSRRIVKHSSKVDVIRWQKNQEEAYTDCWNKHRDEYDWIGFFDIDEFLVLDKGVSLDQLFSRKPYSEASSVRVTWLMFDDNDLIERDISVPVMKAFTHSNTRWVLSKSLYNCHVRSKNISISCHGDDGNDDLMVDINGETCYSCIPETENVSTYHFVPNRPRPYLEVGRLNHYRSKSLMEYIQKVKYHSRDGFNKSHFDKSDGAIGYYFDSPNDVTWSKLDVFVQNGIVPSDEYMDELKKRIVPEAKVAIVAVARRENNYINVWMNYHRKLGIEHFYIYDNSFENEPRLETALSEENGQVTTIVPIYNKYVIQKDSYKDAYEKFGKEHDYMLFIDIDEFLTLERHNTIQQYIRYLQRKCPDFHTAKINWEVYDDSDMITRDISIPVYEAFTHMSETERGMDANSVVKSIVRTNILQIYFPSVHWALSSFQYLKIVNGSGNPIDMNIYTNYTFPQYAVPRDVSVAKIRHYPTKSLQEFIDQQDGTIDACGGECRSAYNKFFSFCKKTQEKIDYYEQNKKRG